MRLRTNAFEEKNLARGPASYNTGILSEVWSDTSCSNIPAAKIGSDEKMTL